MIALDYKSRLPIYEQLYKSITKMAALGAIEEGDSLPSIRALAQELGINPNTVQKTYQMLERDGIIYSVPGKGSYLTPGGSAIRQQREIALDKVENAVRTAVDCGVKEESILLRIHNIFIGKENSND